MKLLKYAVAIVLVLITTTISYAGTLDDVKARGELNCIVSNPFPGFANINDAGEWQGFDVDFCRAVAAAVLGDAKKVKFIPTGATERFNILNSGKGDVLFRNTTLTLQRDAELKLAFQGINYYDGQGFIVSADLGIKSAKELNGASVCIEIGTTTEFNLSEYFTLNDMSFNPVVIGNHEQAQEVFYSGRCNVYTADQSGLYGVLSVADDPSKYVVLPEIISKEPLGPATRQGDEAWGDIVRWVLNATITAEELGITSLNAADMAQNAKNPEVKRMLGSEGDLAGMLGLDANWALNVITQVGNYGEIFERNIGEKTPLGISRGLNALWNDGGLIYSPPFR